MEKLDCLFSYGIMLGVIIYTLLFSKIFINISLYTINIIKIVFLDIIIKPTKLIFRIFKKIIFRPITFLIINIKKILSEFKIILKKMLKKKKKNEYKKDFV